MLINQCAINYQKLSEYIVDITVQEGSIRKRIQIDFRSLDFYHLCGLHKLENYQNLLQKQRIVNQISRSNKISLLIENDNLFPAIHQRIYLVAHLNEIFQNDFKIYNYRDSKNYWSKINADYLIEFKLNKSKHYLFITKRSKSELYVCVSLTENNNNYSANLKPIQIISKSIHKK